MSLPGVRSAEVDWAAGRGEVVYEPRLVSKEDLVRAVPPPYQAKLVGDEAYTPR
jgi:copper chaperone CopZ